MACYMDILKYATRSAKAFNIIYYPSHDWNWNNDIFNLVLTLALAKKQHRSEIHCRPF